MLVSEIQAFALSHLLYGHLGLDEMRCSYAWRRSPSWMDNLSVLGLLLPAWVWVWVRKQHGGDGGDVDCQG